MTTRFLVLAAGALLIVPAFSQENTPPPNATGLHRKTVQQGLAVDLNVEPLTPPGLPLLSGETVTVRLKVTDTTTGAPVQRAHPAAWLDLRPPSEARTSEACIAKLKGFLETGASTPGQDLNIYYVLTLNRDATISVVDPLFGFGGSHLLALVPLRSPGYDWALTSDQRRLFVSMPDSNQVAAVDAISWKVTRNIEVAVHPSRLVLQPDQHYLWVASDASGPDAEDSGVTVIDASSQSFAARIVTGAGPHDIAFSGDNRYAFVANAGGDTISVIDVRSLRKIKDIKTGKAPSSMAWSGKAAMIYVAHRGDGSIIALDPARLEAIGRMETAPGIGPLKFSPGGRFGFAVHTARQEVYILDAMSNRIVQIADTAKDPDQVAFSNTLAYIRHRGSDSVLMIALAEAGRAGKPVEVIEFPGGQNPPGLMSGSTVADGIVEVPSGDAVLVSNAKDKSVYYYKEGMAAPMGSFDNYGREPQAVLVVDRSLREVPSHGDYETSTVLGKPGMYDLVFFLDSPRLVHCFEVPVEPNPNLPPDRNPVDVEFITANRQYPAGQTAHLEFKMFDQAQHKPKSGVRDVSVLVYRAPGNWRQIVAAKETGHPGVYAVEFEPPQPGVYYAHVGSASLRLGFKDAHYLSLEIADGALVAVPAAR